MQESRLTTILNGFGISLGDGIIGLQALAAARETGALTGRVVLGRTEPPAKPLVPQLYRLADEFAEVLPMAEAPRAGRVIDIRDFAFDPRFACVSMIDFFLARLEIKPETIPAALKRNRWLRGCAGALPPLGLPPDYFLLCPAASIALRDMPEPVQAAIVSRLTARGWAPVVTQGAAVPGTVQAPAVRTIQALCALVAGASAVISTDTAMVHLADAFDRPCLALFTTHRPEWRVRDYPLCTPLHLPVPALPESIEFPRSAADLQAARAAWFPEGADLTWLDRALDQLLDIRATPGA
ncbi:MAG TPA: glycosyltransferase family 9 protein [Acidisoma sp.]|uniref:glycosyltransferase family 9 protein n=1 Tax=Acidisoma sp. TaxID=1872115 RepID=UPI002B54FC3D|nr:glycosyltransferase family 9 protein [Acidisoma sp.]HTH99478.1 glycosyltransferase family 9 protein [Acidisoma sp.]